jgi:formamidopyrimidine-DNA glycosylase
VRRVLDEAIQAGGTSLRDFVGVDGTPGYFAQRLRVYEREGRPCDRCEHPLARRIIGQRASYFCPRCQR